MYGRLGWVELNHNEIDLHRIMKQLDVCATIEDAYCGHAKV